MASKLLNQLLDEKFSPSEIIGWLTSEESDAIKWKNFNDICQKEEFITFFLSNLKDQFSSILSKVNPPKQTPAKKPLKKPATPDSNLKKSTIQLKNCSLDESLMNDGIGQITNQFINNSINSTSEDIGSTLFNVSELEITNDGSKSINTSTSSPAPDHQNIILTAKRYSPRKKRVELHKCSPLQGGQISSVFKNSIEFDQNDRSTSKILSLNHSSFPSLNENQSNSFSTSSNFNQSELLESSSINLSQRSIRSSESTSKNKLTPNPISSFFVQNSSPLMSPITNKVSQNRLENQFNISFNSTSTPERNIGSNHRNSKNTPKNLSLGDFIVTESRSSKKGKKHSSKVKTNQHSKDFHSLSNANIHSEQSIKKKKVNPTRLANANEKGNEENSIFGTVSRPIIQNPQFVDIPAIDKSTDNESFQLERGLVKIERQKLPIANSVNNIAGIVELTNKTIDESSEIKILLKPPSKNLQQTAMIVADKNSVHNEKTLNLLSEIYSGFLNHNLILNPMSEFYLIINLITAQYTHCNTQILPSIEKVNESEENSNLDLSNHSSETTKNDSLLSRRSLNFENFPKEDNSNSIKTGNSHQSNISFSDNEYLQMVGGLSHKETQSITALSNKKTENLEINKEALAEETDFLVKNYLDTPHNCVYFAIEVLNRQKTFIKCFDRVTLKLLHENNLINTFKPDLGKLLDVIYSEKVLESNKLKPTFNIGTADLNVRFQIDTDNRENFPSNIAFQCFRKQRDMFYEILKIWEEGHALPGWTFQISLGNKIKSLFGIYVDITNLTHFTRLFTSQMLISCIQSEQQEDLLDIETLNLLKNVKDVNIEKLTQLQKKLITPISQNGPVPLPTFPGIQEFYKDFIFYAAKPMFYTYLENTLIHEITELNDSQFVGSDIEEIETKVDERTKQNFIACLSSLRLLSKFLGYLTALPYKSESALVEDVINTQIALRKSCLPRIDLQYYLRSAVEQGKLSLTVPWIVEYLAMMDPATLRLPYYKKLLEMLYCIYRASTHYATFNLDNILFQKVTVLISLVIGWLFELPSFPIEFYHYCLTKYSPKNFTIICEKNNSITERESIVNTNNDSTVSIKHCLYLDKLEVIDDQVLHLCCPYLREFNVLLSSGTSVNSSASFRHVTPVTSKLHKPTLKNSSKHLELQLEEAFFHGQPASTRKTVEMVSERVASSCVKYICNTLLPVEKRKNRDLLKAIIEKYPNSSESSSKKIEAILSKERSLLMSVALKSADSIKEQSDSVTPKICETRVTQAIELLLAIDCLQHVKEISAKIGIRLAIERVEQWIQSHITGGTIFLKNMESDLNKLIKASDEICLENKCHNQNAVSPVDVLANIRATIWDLLETRGCNLRLEIVSQLCTEMLESLNERSDLKIMTKRVVLNLSVDLVLFLISYRFDLFNDEIQEKIYKIWEINHFSGPDKPLSSLLSHRNITLLSQSENDDAWLNFGKFLRILLKKDILSIHSLSEQSVALLRTEWPVKLMKKLSICLKEAMEDYSSSDEETEKIRYLLQWVVGAYNDMDQDSFTIY